MLDLVASVANNLGSIQLADFRDVIQTTILTLVIEDIGTKVDGTRLLP